MKPETMGLLLGGLIPALFFGIFGVMQKTVSRTGLNPGWYTVGLGIGIFILGGISLFFFEKPVVHLKGLSLAALVGAIWGIASLCISIALNRYDISISRLVPLYNMNTLVAVLLGLVIYAEWASVNLWKLVLGSVLILIGGILVAGS